MDRPWRIELLGRLWAVRGEQVISRFRTQKTGALLAYLAYHPQRSHPREVLIERHWPESDPAAGRHNFSMALSSLRRQLEPPGVPRGAVIVADRASVGLNPATCVTDVCEIQAALRAAAGAGTRLERIRQLEEAAELYRGELLPGYFEDWIVPERVRLAEAFFQAIGQLIAFREQEGDLAGALQWARLWVSAEPLREEAHRDLIRLLAAAGRPEAALRQYRELERLLQMACNAAPEPELSALVEVIRESAAQAPAETGAGVLPSRPLTSSPSRSPTTHFVGAHALPGHPITGFGSPSLPTGTLTLLLTEILYRTGPGKPESGAPEEGGGARPEAEHEDSIERLRQLLRDHGGHELRDSGEMLPAMFGRTSDALAAAAAASTQVKFRAALHTGEVEPDADVKQSPAFRHAVRLLLAAQPGQILLSEKSAALLRDAPVAGVHLIDLGLYRLRDLGEPERLFQARDRRMSGEENKEWAPGDCPSAPPAYESNLPLQFNRFFGRETEMGRLREMLLAAAPLAPHHAPMEPVADSGRLASRTGRLVTLTGPGGCGKTRLALEAAGRLREPWRDAVWFVSLTDLVEPHRIADVIRDALRLPRTPEEKALEQVVAFLSIQPSLLLIDNLEHLLSDGAAVVRTLLERVETLTTVVTSRRRLGIADEQEFPLGPLPVPDSPPSAPYTLMQCPSVQLFVDRAQRVRPDFQVTPGNAEAMAALCRRLEGLPLSLELVAARSQVLAPAQMLARLVGDGLVPAQEGLLVSRQQGGVPRHRSLRTAIDWSYHLLPPDLQRFFARLSIFRGGWTLEAAAAVCDQSTALEALEKLCECSLILACEAGQEMRYRLLESLREYGAERLDPEEQAALGRRHAEFYLALAEKAEERGLSADQKETLDRLEAEHDNLRAVLTWSAGTVGSEEAAGSGTGQLVSDECLATTHLTRIPPAPTPLEIGLRLGGALAGFWMMRGYLREGRERLARLLARAGEARTPERARAQAAAGTVAWGLGAMEEACTLLTGALTLARQLDARYEIAWSLRYLGYVAIFRGEYGSARTFLEESRTLWGELGNTEQAAGCLNALGHVARYQGDYETARAAFEHDLERLRAVGDRDSLATQLKDLGILARYRGDYAEARSLFEESLALRRALGFRKGIAISLSGLADVYRDQGDLATARRLYEEALPLRQELGERFGVAGVLALLALVIRLQGDPDQARTLYRQSLAIRREILDRRGIAECLEGLATVAAVEQQTMQAARRFGAAQSLRVAIGSKAPPWEQREQERTLAGLREALGEGGFLEAWTAGCALSWEQAVAEALRDA